MAYNPYHINPPEDPNAKFCVVCGEAISHNEIDYEEVHWLPNGDVVHKEDCICSLVDSQWYTIGRLKERLADAT